jgi:phosphatidylserine/phosphatidylglycerophosphate/cardiolipin synthase-like enzyme
MRVEAVWSGPNSHAVPVRATLQVLVDLVSGAQAELLLMTYSAKPHSPLIEALTAARERGMRVSVVVETLQGAGGAIERVDPQAVWGQRERDRSCGRPARPPLVLAPSIVLLLIR